MKLYRMIFSPTDGTEKVASALNYGWNYEQETVSLLEVNRDYRVYKLGAGDAYTVVVPPFGGRVPTVALEQLSSMREDQARAVLAAVCDNRDFEDTSLELEDILEAAGFRCMVTVATIAGHSIMHQLTTGRPDEKGVTQLRTFAKQIREKLKRDKTQELAFVLGDRPYRRYSGIPLRPKADKTCRQCGVCVRECPIHAIPREDMTRADEDMCISCMRCITVYPSGSRKLSKVMMNVAAQKLKKACAEPKQNELFL